MRELSPERVRLQATIKRVLSSKKSAREFLIGAGLLTKRGKLPKEYGGPGG